MKNLTKKTKISNMLYVIECTDCGNYAASASEYSLLPNFASCKCENNGMTFEKLAVKLRTLRASK